VHPLGAWRLRVGAILGPEQRHELALHASWRILGLDAVGELRARAAAEVRFVRRQVEQRAPVLAVRAAKERTAAAEVARHAVEQDRRAAPFPARPDFSPRLRSSRPRKPPAFDPLAEWLRLS